MSNVVRLSDYLSRWKQIYAIDTEHATLQVYIDESNGELEIVQMNDEGEAIRTCLSTVDSVALSEALSKAHQKIGSK